MAKKNEAFVLSDEELLVNERILFLNPWMSSQWCGVEKGLVEKMQQEIERRGLAPLREKML